MKLEKYIDKEQKRRKIILISISVIVLISVSFLLYKTFAVFTENAQFPMMKGKVDYFGNSDVYFAFYQGDKQLEEMPQKDNKDNLVFDHGECDNGAKIEWNSEEWGPMVKNLSKSKTKCSLYFKVQKEIVLGKDILPVESGDGLYAVPHNDLTELGSEWNKTEYRYAGVDPDNYVSFNNELWRIIGLVNAKVGNSVEQRIKIVRQDGVEGQKDFGNYPWDRPESEGYTSNWTTSKLKDMLNGIYYESGIGECYRMLYSDGSTQLKTCDFKSGTDMPKGLDEIEKNMIDKEVIWNNGGWDWNEITTKQFYEKERGSTVYSSNPKEWSKDTEVGEKHNGIGLFYPSDYGYAVGEEIRNNCLTKNMFSSVKDNCSTNDWLTPSKKFNNAYDSFWTLSPFAVAPGGMFAVNTSGTVGYSNFVYNAFVVWQALYLTTSTKIVDEKGTEDSPFILEM